MLMLRGPQTPGELRQRTERLHAFADGELEATLEGLIERGSSRARAPAGPEGGALRAPAQRRARGQRPRAMPAVAP